MISSTQPAHGLLPLDQTGDLLHGPPRPTALACPLHLGAVPLGESQMRQRAIGQQGDVHLRSGTPVGRLDQQVESLALQAWRAVRVLHQDEEGLGSLLAHRPGRGPLTRSEHGAEPDEVVSIDSCAVFGPSDRVAVRDRPTGVLIPLAPHQDLRCQQ